MTANGILFKVDCVEKCVSVRNERPIFEQVSPTRNRGELFLKRRFQWESFSGGRCSSSMCYMSYSDILIFIKIMAKDVCSIMLSFLLSYIYSPVGVLFVNFGSFRRSPERRLSHPVERPTFFLV